MRFGFSAFFVAIHIYRQYNNIALTENGSLAKW